MYWRVQPLFDLEQPLALRLRRKPERDNALVAALAEMVKYLGITAAIYLVILVVVSIF